MIETAGWVRGPWKPFTVVCIFHPGPKCPQMLPWRWHQLKLSTSNLVPGLGVRFLSLEFDPGRSSCWREGDKHHCSFLTAGPSNYLSWSMKFSTKTFPLKSSTKKFPPTFLPLSYKFNDDEFAHFTLPSSLVPSKYDLWLAHLEKLGMRMRRLRLNRMMSTRMLYWVGASMVLVWSI